MQQGSSDPADGCFEYTTKSILARRNGPSSVSSDTFARSDRLLEAKKKENRRKIEQMDEHAKENKGQQEEE